MEDKFELDEERLKFLTSKFNRSKNQTQFLYNLVDCDFDKLLELEIKMRKKYISYCPGDTEEVNKILNLK